jgi:pimeloyl-ACP methyl ester carboxylesterase
MTGTVLADAIVRADLRNVVLVGFSLGARVMAAAAEALATRDFEEPRVKSMHLLGGAVSTKRPWHSIENAVEDKVWNYWSADDKILSAVYRTGEAGSKAIGATGIPARSARIKNVDVSRSVKTHFDYLKHVKLR